MKADSTMGASSGNTRSRLCFVFPPCTCTLSVSQSPSQARKQAISAHTILYVQYTQERTHARTHIRADSTHTISYCTTQHHSLFSPIISICALLFPPPFPFIFFSFLSFCLLTPFIYTMIASLNFSVLFLLSPICSSLLSFLNLSSLRPPTLFHSSLSFFSLASPPLLKCGMIANNLEI